jgi:hypothetical protein
VPVHVVDPTDRQHSLRHVGFIVPAPPHVMNNTDDTIDLKGLCREIEFFYTEKKPFMNAHNVSLQSIG